MSIDQLATHLLRLEVFQDLSPTQLNEVARRAERIVYKPGQLIIADGEPGDAAVLVIGGEAMRIIGQPGGNITEREPVEPGSLLGEMTMLIETEYSSTVVATTPVRALRIRRDGMLEMMLADRSLAEHFVQKIARRLKRISTELHRIESTLDGLEQTYIEVADAPTPARSKPIPVELASRMVLPPPA